ncbi:hypothetical protein MPSEU_000695400 [Mayamaea pseudoterrestris]|nr:hypothetical protein MPSEU_000695400 [Mayamaea pseudoterrestris]
MPITPQFTLSQTDSHIILDISVPHVRVNLDSMHLALSEANHRLHWACPPYLLILNFERALAETAAEQAEAESEAAAMAAAAATFHPMIQNGTLRLMLAKAQPNLTWTDLDLLGKLMPIKQDARQTTSQWIQQVVKESTTTKTASNGCDGEATAASDSHAIAGSYQSSWSSSNTSYGFMRMFQGVFVDWTRDGLAKEMYESPWPEEGATITIDSNIRSQRRKERRNVEQEAFDSERYLQDMECQDDYLYMSAMSMRPHWITNDETNQDNLPDLLQSMSLVDNKESCLKVQYFTQDESIQLASIPYPLLPPIDPAFEDGLLLGLLDILFAYAYDHLMTDGDPTVESAWTISILSASFSWLNDWLDDAWILDKCSSGLSETLDTVILSSTRRSLIYPYLRNLHFAVKIWQHVGCILARGRRCAIRCLLQVREILHQSELYYLNNKLLVDPYLAWLQQSHGSQDLERKMKELSEQLKLKVVAADDDLRDRLELGLAEIENTVYDAYLQSDEVNEEERYSAAESDDGDEDSDCGDDSDSSDGEADASDSSETQKATLKEKQEAELQPLRSTELLNCSLGVASLNISGVIPQGRLTERENASTHIVGRPIIEILPD